MEARVRRLLELAELGEDEADANAAAVDRWMPLARAWLAQAGIHDHATEPRARALAALLVVVTHESSGI